MQHRLQLCQRLQWLMLFLGLISGILAHCILKHVVCNLQEPVVALVPISFADNWVLKPMSVFHM